MKHTYYPTYSLNSPALSPCKRVILSHSLSLFPSLPNWTSPGSNTPQGTNYTATCLPSWKLSGHCWRSKDEPISDVLLLTPTYGWAKAGWPAWTYIQQLCEDTGCSPEDLPEAMNDREKWRDRVRDIRASSTTWWWCLAINYTKQKFS